MKPFVHLHVHSPYSFLDGASSLRELLTRAAEEGQPGLALTDVHSLAGAVEALQEGKRQGLQVALGAEVFLEPLAFPRKEDLYPLVLLALGPRGYRQLSRLLTASLLTYPEKPRVTHEMLAQTLERAGGELFLLTGGRRGELAQRLLRGDREGARAALEALLRLLPRTTTLLLTPKGKPSSFPLAVELVNPFYPGGRRLQKELFELAQIFALPPLAANDVRYARPQAYPFYDVMVCIREGIDVSVPHPERPLNAQQDLKGTAEMA
ncbi:MAG: PHP domain-containing protein, partial [Bacillota bacterium]|nr:PHP domain-containing protein [Bacillota bacterium]